MLFPQPSISSFKNALEAICYQKNQIDSFRIVSSSPLQVNARKTVHFSFFPSRANAMMADEELMLRIKAACMHILCDNVYALLTAPKETWVTLTK